MRAVVRPAIVVARTRDREADVAEGVRRLAAEIEWAIRERPHQWFCFRRLWGA
jgi:lauroyl/myristoyl acyltransferase